MLSLLKDYPQLLRGRPGNFVFMIYILYSIFCLFHFYLSISRGRPGNHFSFISFLPGNPNTSSQPILHQGVLIDPWHKPLKIICDFLKTYHHN